MRTLPAFVALLGVASTVMAAEKTATTAPGAANGPLPVIREAGIAKGHLTVNGQPFFPILLYDAPTDPATLATLRASGFNTLTVSKPEDAEALPAQGFYAAVHAGAAKVEKRGGVLLAVGTDSPSLNFKENMLQKTREENAKAKAMVPGRPLMNAIGYWLDEPEGVKAGKLPGKDKYEDLVNALEVAAPYLYPVPHQPVASVGEAVARAEAATGGKKPLLPILQLFAWDAADRYPTPAELRCMVYLALIGGADGIGYYSYGSVTGKKDTTLAKEQPELWKSVTGLNAEIKAIAPVLLAGEADPAVKLASGAGTAGLKLRAVRDGKRGVVLVANPTDKPAELRFDPAPAGLRPLSVGAGADKTPRIDAGQLQLQLAPFAAGAMEYEAAP